MGFVHRFSSIIWLRTSSKYRRIKMDGLDCLGSKSNGEAIREHTDKMI